MILNDGVVKEWIVPRSLESHTNWFEKEACNCGAFGETVYWRRDSRRG